MINDVDLKKKIFKISKVLQFKNFKLQKVRHTKHS